MMVQPYHLIYGLVLVTVLSSFLRVLTEAYGFSIVIPIVRDLAMLGLVAYGFRRLNGHAFRVISIAAIVMLLFSAIYIFVSISQDEFFAGLYYLRVYLTPALYFVAMVCFLHSSKNVNGFEKSLLFIVRLNYWLFFSALALYVFLDRYPEYRFAFLGTDFLADAWFISGGVWMRMGLPATGPNTLGLIFSLNIILFATSYFDRNRTKSKTNISQTSLAISIALSLIGLILTFSRSSMLMVFVAMIFIFKNAGLITANNFYKLFLYAIFAITVGSVIFVLVDIWSDGYLSVWFDLNVDMADPSAAGHIDSVVDAINSFEEYYGFGYPRGTVGPKAELFGGVVYHVENSFLAIMFEMGVFIGFMYWLLFALIYLSGYKRADQLIVLISFLPPLLLLPYVFEADALVYLSFIYIVLGSRISTSNNDIAVRI